MKRYKFTLSIGYPGQHEEEFDIEDDVT